MPRDGKKASNAVVARSPIDIGEVVGFDIERLKGQAMPLRPPLQERVEDGFPRSRVDARRIGQHAVEIEDRGVEVAPVYRDCTSTSISSLVRVGAPIRRVAKCYNLRRAPPLWDSAPRARCPSGSPHAALPTFLSRRGR